MVVEGSREVVQTCCGGSNGVQIPFFRGSEDQRPGPGDNEFVLIF